MTEPPGFANSAFPEDRATRELRCLTQLDQRRIADGVDKVLPNVHREEGLLRDGDRDLLGADGRLVGNVQRVAEHELQTCVVPAEA